MANHPLHWQKHHPWNGGWAIPASAKLDSVRKGAITTEQRRRGSMDAPALPGPWKSGYAFPSYLKAEPLGRGAFYTHYMPRRTVDTLVPKYLAGLGSLGSDFDIGRQGDPIAEFGQKSARAVMKNLRSVPKKDRKEALRALFAQLDPRLDRRVQQKAGAFRRRGIAPKKALEAAMASSMSLGMLEQMIKLGKKKTRNPPLRSYAAMATCEGRRCALDGLLGDIGKVVSAPFAAAGGAAKDVTKGAAKFGEASVKAIGKLACKMSSNPLGQAAAAGGAAAAGAPPQAGMMGAQAIASSCAKTPPIQPAFWQSPTGGISPTVLILGGGAALAVVALIATRK